MARMGQIVQILFNKEFNFPYCFSPQFIYFNIAYKPGNPESSVRFTSEQKL